MIVRDITPDWIESERLDLIANVPSEYEQTTLWAALAALAVAVPALRSMEVIVQTLSTATARQALDTVIGSRP